MNAPFRFVACVSVSIACCAANGSAQSRIELWGGTASQFTVPPLPPGTNWVEAQIGIFRFVVEPPGIPPHVIALRDDGQIVVFGDTSSGQGSVPPLPAGVRWVEVDAGPAFCVARRSDGQLRAWGTSMWGSLTPPPIAPGITYVEVAAGAYASIARRSDGVIVSWGGGAPALDPAPPGTSYTRVDAGAGHMLALRSDGQLRAWGFNDDGQTVVPPLPAGTTYVDMAAGMYHSVALRSDGAVVAWGSNFYGACNVPAFPPGLAVTDLVAGPSYSAARLSNGAIQVWGSHAGGFGNVPPLVPGERFTQLSAGGEAFVAVVRSGVEFYGDARPNSLGCTPSMGASGTSSAGLSSGFFLSCINARNNSLGMLIYTVNGARAATPFQCATRLVGPSNIRRTPIRSAGGASSGADCSGVFLLDMNAYAAGAAGGAPSQLLSQPGTLVHAQWWGRDNGYAPPCNTMLSNAIEYVVLH